jgi:urea transport system permease protein
VSARLAWGERLGVLFTGISLGSILLLVALGLAITYGLMGVINMAHGELMMIGAYATYVVQGLFQPTAGALDWYLLAGGAGRLPGLGPGGRGAGAPGDPLALRPPAGDPAGHLGHLAGADAGRAQPLRRAERGVENPAWMSGGVALMPNLTLPWNRIAIIAFAFPCCWAWRC